MENLFNEQEERFVLSAILSHPDCFAIVRQELASTDFHSWIYAKIYEAMERAADSGFIPDEVTVSEMLHRFGIQNTTEMLAELDTWQPAADIMNHVSIIKDYSKRRLLIDIAKAIEQQAHEDNGSASEKIIEVQDLLAATLSDNDSMKSPAEDIEESFKALESEDDCIKTGFQQLDKKIPLAPGTVFVIAAATGLGKSALAESIAINIALQKRQVVFFTLEMPRNQVLYRAYSQLAKIDSQRIIFKKLTTAEKEKIRAVGHQLDTMKVIDTGDTTSAIKSRCLALQAENGLDLAIIDYVGLLQAENLYGSRANELDTICKNIKSLAVRLNIPIILLAQINRNVDAKQDKRPGLGDIRESAGIVNFADYVGMLYRESYYSGDGTDTSAELIIKKNRSGWCGTIKLEFCAPFCLFTNPRQKR